MVVEWLEGIRHAGRSGVAAGRGLAGVGGGDEWGDRLRDNLGRPTTIQKDMIASDVTKFIFTYAGIHEDSGFIQRRGDGLVLMKGKDTITDVVFKGKSLYVDAEIIPPQRVAPIEEAAEDEELAALFAPDDDNDEEAQALELALADSLEPPVAEGGAIRQEGQIEDQKSK